jgi:hypothetical protein
MVAATVVFAVTWLACGSSTPTAPATSSPQARVSDPASGVGALNQPPVLRLKTTPEADKTGAGWTVAGEAPFTVQFNLCTSGDPDMIINPDGTPSPRGDQINWQFNFGEPLDYGVGSDGTPSPDPAFNRDGTFRADFGGFCRVEHTYQTPGTYIATVSVTDQHLEDQSGGVRALARQTQRVKILALRDDPYSPCQPPTSKPIPTWDGGCVGPGDWNDEHPVASYFSGDGLTYSATFTETCDLSGRGWASDASRVRSMDAPPGACPWVIDPVKGVISAQWGCGCTDKVITVTATNECGATNQTFAFHFCID